MNLKSIFLEVLNADRIRDDAETLAEYGKDRTKDYAPDAGLVVFPKTPQEVQDIVRIAYERNIPLVPSGGRTGYAAGAVARNREVVISLEKMNAITAIDVEGGVVRCEAGVILENLQNAVAEEGMYLPLDFAARGSCQIGGCLSTNAGGLKVLKYGMTRDLVLGLEAVIANGEWLTLNEGLYKNNAGYDLKQLFIGAEGTLGIITQVALKIVPPPKRLQAALLAVTNFVAILAILKAAKLRALDITAFEFFTEAGLKAVLEHIPDARNPFDGFYPFYVLLEIDAGTDGDALSGFLEALAEKEMVADGTIASGSAQFKALWGLRENISESISRLGHFHKNDISVPVSSLSRFIPEFEELIRTSYRGFEVLFFGHIGDGNIHVNVIDRTRRPPEEFLSLAAELDKQMAEKVCAYGGSISAEHGIGLLKKNLLPYQRNALQLELMRSVKRIFDPKNLFNPGKIIDMK